MNTFFISIGILVVNGSQTGENGVTMDFLGIHPCIRTQRRSIRLVHPIRSILTFSLLVRIAFVEIYMLFWWNMHFIF